MSGLEILSIARPFAVSLIIGLVIGLERERSHKEGTQSLGVRTFALLGLLGTLTASLDQIALQIAVSIFSLAAILLGYWKTARIFKSDPQLGLTTEIAGAIVFSLGVLSVKDTLLSAILGLVVLLLLIAKKRLHRFARNSLTQDEIRAFITLLIIGIGLIPALPDRSIDPWNLINPQRIGIILCVLASLQFGGYVMTRLVGHKMGAALTGFFGGFVSSTVVFLDASKSAQKSRAHSDGAALSACLSAASSYLLLFIMLWISSPRLGQVMSVSLLSLILSGSLISWIWLGRRSRSSASELRAVNPLDLKAVVKLTVFFAGMLFVVGLAQIQLGSNATSLLSFLGGLFELHTVSLATANLIEGNAISIESAKINVGLALLGSLVSKLFISFTMIKGAARNLIIPVILGMFVAGTTCYFIF